MSDVRVRVALAVVQEGRILLVPHYDTDAGPVQWTIPGGRLEFGEGTREAAAREFEEETGLRADLLTLDGRGKEVYNPYKPWNAGEEADVERSIGSTDLRQRLTDVLQDIREARETYVVETFGRPQVAIIDLEEYRAFKRYRAERQGMDAGAEPDAGERVETAPQSGTREEMVRAEARARARLQDRLLSQMERVSVNDLCRVLNFAEALAMSEPRGVPGRSRLDFAGTISPEDAEQMRIAVEEGCEQISDEG